MRSKVSVLYEHVFAARGEVPKSLWHELFLLKPDPQALIAHIKDTQSESLHKHRPQISLFLRQCVSAVMAPNSRSYSQLYAMQTAQILLDHVFSRRWNNFTFDTLNCICGLDEADSLFRGISSAIQIVIDPVGPPRSDRVHLDAVLSALNLLWCILSASSSTSVNGLIAFFISKPVFSSLISLFKLSVNPPDLQENIHRKCLMIVAVISNYKRDASKPAMKYLAAIHDEEVLKQIVSTIHSVEHSLVRRGSSLGSTGGQGPPSAPSSVFGYIFAMVSPPAVNTKIVSRIDTPRLLALHTFLQENDEFRKLWLADEGLLKFIPYALLEFCKGQSLVCLYCLQIVGMLLPYSASIGKDQVAAIASVVKSDQGILSADISPFKKHVLSEFDSNLPMFSLLLAYIGLNERLNHNRVVAVAFQLMLNQMKLLKQEKIRRTFEWDHAYVTILNSLKYFIRDREIVSNAVSTLDFILCFGDYFLSDTRSYDMLFYTIILNSSTFEKIDIERCKNIKAVYRGFMNKYGQKSPDSPERVLQLIQQFYDDVELDLKGSYNYKWSNTSVDNLISAVVEELQDSAE